MGANRCCRCQLTRTKSISSLFSIKFKMRGFTSSHMPPSSLKTPSSWKVLLTCKHKQTHSVSGNGVHSQSQRESGNGPHLVDYSLGRWSVWGVKDLPHEQRLQRPPDHPGNGAGLHVLHQVVAVGGWKITADIVSLFALANHLLGINNVSARQLLDTHLRSCRRSTESHCHCRCHDFQTRPCSCCPHTS